MYMSTYCPHILLINNFISILQHFIHEIYFILTSVLLKIIIFTIINLLLGTLLLFIYYKA